MGSLVSYHHCDDALAPCNQIGSNMEQWDTIVPPWPFRRCPETWVSEEKQEGLRHQYRYSSASECERENSERGSRRLGQAVQQETKGTGATAEGETAEQAESGTKKGLAATSGALAATSARA